MESPINPSELPMTPALPGPRRSVRMFAIVAGCLVLFAGAYGVIRWSLGNGQAAVDPPPQAAKQSKYFAGWTKPDFALIISGQMHGYTQPCGCSDPQYGGLARRWEFIESLKKKGWPVAPVDLGDIYPKSSDTPAQQNLLKFETALRAMHVMGYHAFGIGKQELGVPLATALGQYSLNNERPRPVAANLDGVLPGGAFHAMNARPLAIVDGNGLPKIGVVGMIGKSVQDHFKGQQELGLLKFNAAQAPAALKELAGQKTAFNVVLMQTDEKFQPGAQTEVEKCIVWCQEQKTAPLHVVVYSSDDPEPPGIPRDLNGTQLISVGHKGRYVGVLGVWKKGDSYEYKYEMVLIGPEFNPKPGNPVSKLMEEYTARVMKQGLMAKFPFTTHPIQAVLRNDHEIETKYAGSQRCMRCHKEAHKIWAGSAHANATVNLQAVQNPKLREFDGECMQCHTTGFKHAGGFNDPKAIAIKDRLNGVGCESCHGPASAHADDPDDMRIRKLINPWAKQYNQGIPEQARKQRINTFCQSCHDIDNDVHWDFTKRWPGVEHMTPPAAPANGKKQNKK